MLDKKDIKAIQGIVGNSLTDFFERMTLPYLEENEKAHKDLIKRHDKHDEDFDKVFRKLERNDDQHDEILQDLNKMEKTFDNHERRIKRVETITAA